MARQPIIKGPGKFALMSALFEGKLVRFTVGGLGLLEARIQSIGREDGSNESWLIEGASIAVPIGTRFHGYYQTRTRKGWLEFKQTS